MSNAHKCLCLAASFLLISQLLAESFPKDAQGQLDNFCRRFSHRTAVVNNRLYIDGGFVNSNPLSQDPKNYTNPDIFYADLLTTSNGMPTMRTLPKKNATVPSLAGGALWADSVNNVFYAFGGYFSDLQPSLFVTWLYIVALESWTSVSTTGNSSYVAYGMATVADDAGVGYYLGGYQDNQTQSGWTGSRLYTSNLLSFDMTTRTYANNSGPDKSGRGEGLMAFIPASTSGLLISFGGLVQDPLTGETSGAPMNDIHIFDIATSKWYNQNATGDVPEQRTRFCGGATWPDDKSSFEIYIYGGLRPNGINIDGFTAFDDIYVLTLPAFVWVKWWPTTSYGVSFPHHSMTCNVINGTQMIIMGGTFPNSSQCDVPTIYGLHSANLGQNNPNGAAWNTFVLDFPPYTVPRSILDVVGGTPKGGANVTQPLNSTLSYDYYLFQRVYKVSTRTPTPTITNSPLAKTSSSNLSTGALVGTIAGSLVGGILLGLAALGGFLLFRKSKNKSTWSNAHELNEHHKLVELEDHKAATELEDKQTSEMPGGQQDAREMYALPVELPGHMNATLHIPQEYHAR